MRHIPIVVFQSDGRTPVLSSTPTTVPQGLAVSDSPLAAAVATSTASPSPALLGRLVPDRRASFLRVWARLPPHLRAIEFDLHYPERTPLAIKQLGDVLSEIPDVCSTSKTVFGSCSLMPFDISVPEGSAPATIAATYY